MSVEAIAWVLNHAPVESPVSKLVLVALANHAHPDGSAAFPSVSTICRYTCLSERSVRQHLDNLEKQGIIERCDQRIVAAYIDRSDRRPIGYNILLGGVQQTQVAASRGAVRASSGVQEIPKRGAGDAPKPSNKPSKETHEILLSIFVESLEEFSPPEVSSPQPSPEWSATLKRIARTGVTEARFTEIVEFALQDTFWRRNIRTPMRLEKHWDRLLLEIPPQTLERVFAEQSRLTDAETQIHNFVRLKRSRDDIMDYIQGQPESLQNPLRQHYDQLVQQ